VGFLLDIDGTLLDSGREIDGAADSVTAMRALGHRLLFATNTSRKSRAEIAASLRRAGVDAREDEVWSASWAAAVWLRDAGVRRVHLLLTPSAIEDWTDFERVDVEAEAVVVGDLGPLFDFERLDRAFRCLRGGARLVAAHRNRFWKNDAGVWSLDAGPFVAALEYAAETSAELIGKPASGFFRAAGALLGEDVSSLSIVGDDLEVDVAGGRAAGLDTWLVKTGKFDEARLAAATPERAPHHVIDSIRDLPDRLR
jgi:HAD superfamily hydrolase (TIGR01458 family)